MADTVNKTLLYLCRNDVEQICREIDSVAVIREVFRLHGTQQTCLPNEAYLSWENGHGEQVRSLNMPGYLGHPLNIAGTKIINGNINNPSRGLPRASGMTALYENSSARILCLMEGAFISSLRTASVTALAVDLLANPVSCLAVIGAGVLAQAHIELLSRRLPALRQIMLFDLSRERIVTLLSTVAPALRERGITLQATSTAEEAIRAAQLIVPVTTTTVGYIPFSWLQPGALLVNVSLDDPLPEVVFQASAVIVDDWHLVKEDERRLLGRMVRAGQIIGPDDAPNAETTSARQIDAQLGEIVIGTKAGRHDEHDIILVNPFGLAIEDIALAASIYQIARERGVGMYLPR